MGPWYLVEMHELGVPVRERHIHAVVLTLVGYRSGRITGGWRPVKSHVAPGRIELRYVRAESQAVVTLEADPENGELGIRAAITSKSDEPISSVTLTPLRGLAVCGDASDDRWLVSHHKF